MLRLGCFVLFKRQDLDIGHLRNTLQHDRRVLPIAQLDEGAGRVYPTDEDATEFPEMIDQILSQPAAGECDVEHVITIRNCCS